ncbi:MAG: hypothetical protein R3Y26_06735 [Rikenellaceae bacterium]
MTIAVLFPTITEAKYFNNPDVDVYYSGVGLTASTYNTTCIIKDKNPDILIMAGIAGVYKHSSLTIGDSVIVSHERQSDLGFFYPEGFKHISKMNLDMEFEVYDMLESPYLEENLPFKTAKSNSMNAAMAEFVETKDVEIENMEGAAFFEVCIKENKRFYELRTISNVVDIEHDDWDYETSIKNLTKSLNELIDYLKA